MISFPSANPVSGHVMVIGGGVVGLCSAYYLAKAGLEVTIVDSRSQQAPSCSTGNNGMIVPSHFIPLAAPGMVAKGLRMMMNRRSPFFIRPRASYDLVRWCFSFIRNATQAHVEKCATILRDLNLESRKLYLEIAHDEAIDFQLQKRGLLMLCATLEGFDKETEIIEQAKALGLDVEALDIVALRALEPNVEINAVGAVHYRDDCHLSPETFLEKLYTKLQAMGVKYLCDATVDRFFTSGRNIEGVSINGVARTPDHIVLTAGVWSKELAKKLGIHLLMQSGKGYSLTLDNPVAMPENCAILSEGKVAVTPMNGRLRFGGAMEVGGVEGVVDQRRLQGIIDTIPDVYPQFTAQHFEGVEPWHGLRPCSADGMPYLGYSRKWDNLVVATGHSMMGISMGPVTGKIVAELTTCGASSYPLSGCNVDRY